MSRANDYSKTLTPNGERHLGAASLTSLDTQRLASAARPQTAAVPVQAEPQQGPRPLEARVRLPYVFSAVSLSASPVSEDRTQRLVRLLAPVA
jgi:hypothetical protein